MTKKCIATLCLIVFSILTISAQDWQRFKEKELGFIADFPAQPKQSIQKVPTAVGELDMHMTMLDLSSKTDANNIVYSIIRTDYPDGSFEDTEESHNKVLDGAVQGAVTNVKGTLVFDNKLMFNGYRGRNLKIKVQGGFMYLNTYLVDNSIFIAQVICNAPKDNNSDINRFLESFDLIKIK